MTLPDPRKWEQSKCACPRIDARDCREARSNRIPFDDNDRRCFEDEPCECSCHEPDEDDYDDEY